MIFPASVIICVLETMSYETWITITRFPCSATVRQELADNLVDIGFIYLEDGKYGLTETGQNFLNNVVSHTTI